jgi:hypothetical protein
MTIERFRIAPPNRRQLLRKSLTLGVGLAVRTRYTNNGNPCGGYSGRRSSGSQA